MSLRMEPAKRVFAKEFNASSLIYKVEEDKYSLKYLVTPTGAKCIRLFVVGVLTEKTRVTGNGGGQWRVQVADPTGVFDVYAGSQYEAQASEYLLTAPTPSFVAMMGKPRLFEMTRSGRGIALALNPELMVATDSMSRDIWTQETIRQTLDRIDLLKAGVSADARIALEHYGGPKYADYKAMLETAYAALPKKIVSKVRP